MLNDKMDISVPELIAEETSMGSGSEINTRELAGNPLFNAIPLLEDDINGLGGEVKTPHELVSDCDSRSFICYSFGYGTIVSAD